MRDDLEGMTVFAAVAEARSLRAAGDRLGVTGAAVGQALRRLEDRLGLALVERTTRSLRLTDAGARLYGALRPALDEVGATLAALGELRGRPAGPLRLSVSSVAEGFLAGPTLAGFLAAYPDVRLEVMVSDDESDVVAEGFDAGVRLGEVIDQDMLAFSVSGEQRQLVVAAPAYLARRGAPAHPRDLATPACIGWRRGVHAAPYRWEFTEPAPHAESRGGARSGARSGAPAGRDFAVAVTAHVDTNDMALMVRLARAGVGLAVGLEETFRPFLTRGELVPVLEAYCPPFPGFYLYYPRRRHPPPPMRALVDYVRRRTRAPAR